jgi:hypothetical protein
MRAKLIAANRERVMALPDMIEGEWKRLNDTPAENVHGVHKSEPNQSQ